MTNKRFSIEKKWLLLFLQELLWYQLFFNNQYSVWPIIYYRPHMRVGNVFGRVSVSVCVSVYLSVQAITFEPLDIETSFLVCRYILTYLGQVWVSRSLDQGQGHIRKNDSFTDFNFLILCMWLQVFNKVKVTHQGEGHIKVKVKISSSFPTLCKIYLF